VTQQQRQLFILLRAALIQALNVIEDALGMPRTIPCRAERRSLQRAEDMLK
jgi:hypothetical protein